jgi:thiamine-phosphate pyrophosphorylase
METGADGVHVGQSDMEAGEVRAALGPGKILGVSAGTVEEALLAERRGADYLGVGAVFPTGTKKDADAVSIAALRDICAAVSIPVIAIGGVTKDNIGLLAGTGIAGVAVVSAVFAAPDVERAASELKAAVRGALKL